VQVPLAVVSLLADLESLSPGRIRALAAGFHDAEASPVRCHRRAMARRLAMSPDAPGVISLLAGQLALSDAMISWEAVYDLDHETAYGARAALLDMGLVACADAMSASEAEALAEPWLAAKLVS
jgi:hypothetical protein